MHIPPPGIGHVQSLYETASDVEDNLRSIGCRLASLCERLGITIERGPDRPANPAETKPTGKLDQLQNRLASLRGLSLSIFDEVAALEQLAPVEAPGAAPVSPSGGLVSL